MIPIKQPASHGRLMPFFSFLWLSFVDEVNAMVRMQSSFDPDRGEFACPMQLGSDHFILMICHRELY